MYANIHGVKENIILIFCDVQLFKNIYKPKVMAFVLILAIFDNFLVIV